MKTRIQNPESRNQNLILPEGRDGSPCRIFLTCLVPITRLGILLFVLLVSSWLKGATVLIPLQTCGISPAANRNVTLTPLQALGANSVPVMDRIQGTTDANGDWSPALLPGVYRADVRPAWGAVGVTEFYFYVDPSNAVQNAFANLLTCTNNTWPPNQYAYSAQASDARYAQAGSVEGFETYSFQTDTNHIYEYFYSQGVFAGIGVTIVTNILTWANNFTYLDFNGETRTGAYTNMTAGVTNIIAWSFDNPLWWNMTNSADLFNGNLQHAGPSSPVSLTGVWQDLGEISSNLFVTYGNQNLSVPNLSTNNYVSCSQFAPNQGIDALPYLHMNVPAGTGIDIFGQALLNSWHVRDASDGWSEYVDNNVEQAWLPNGEFYITDTLLYGLHWVGNSIIQDGKHDPGTNYLGDFQLQCGAARVHPQPTIFSVYDDYGLPQQVTPLQVSAKNNGQYFFQLDSVTNGGKVISAILLNNTNNDYPVVITNCLVETPTNYDPSTWSPIPGNVIFKGSNGYIFCITTSGTNSMGVHF